MRLMIMTIFDELLSQVEDNTVEDTFESDLSSLFTDDTDTELYSEAEEEITPEKVAEMKAKAKKIKKAIKIALVALAVIIGAKMIIKSNAAEKLALQHEITKLKAEKAEIQKSSSADKSKLSELDTKIKKLEAEKKDLEKTKAKYDKTDEAKNEKNKERAKKVAEKLKDIKNKIDDATERTTKEEINKNPSKWAENLNKLFIEAERLIAEANVLTGNNNKTVEDLQDLQRKRKSAAKTGIGAGVYQQDKKKQDTVFGKIVKNSSKNIKNIKDISAYDFTDKDHLQYDSTKGEFQTKADGKNSKFRKLVVRKSSYGESVSDMDIYIDASMFTEYSNFIESATDKFFENEISFEQLCTLNGKAIEKYGDIMINEATSVPDEYDLIMDAICEKFNNNKISIEQAVLLMEKAGDKYLDEPYEESLDDDDSDDQLLMAAEESADYNAEYERLVDAICEKYNNNEISADDTILLLEKAVDKYSIDYSSDDLYDDTYEESSDDDDDSDYTSIFDDDDTD